MTPKTKYGVVAALAAALVGGTLLIPQAAQAQWQRDRFGRTPWARERYERMRVARAASQLERSSNAFRDTYEHQVRDDWDRRDRRDRRDRWDRSRYEDVKRMVQRLDERIERLDRDVRREEDYRRDFRGDVEDVLSLAAPVNREMGDRRRFSSEVRDQWLNVRSDLNELAGIFRLRRL